MTTTVVVKSFGRLRRDRTTGAILMASGRVPKTQRIFKGVVRFTDYSLTMARKMATTDRINVSTYTKSTTSRAVQPKFSKR